MKKLTFIFALLYSIGAFVIIDTAGCQSHVTLATGGAYTDPVLAVTDQAILDASHSLSGFLDWTTANATFLAAYPAVGALAAQVAVQKDGWIRDAYAARDAYASAASDYKLGKGDPATVNSKQAALNGAIAVLNNITAQITAYQTAHPHAS